jgi:20S proteasome alpha/beta subunit
VQIEYALNAVAAGATSLGISATDGVVIATEKKLPSILVDEATVQKICMLTPNIGVVYSGMGPDYRVLVRKARKTAQAYHRLYNEHIPVAQLVRETAAVMQEFTRKCNSVVLSQAVVFAVACAQVWQAHNVTSQLVCMVLQGFVNSPPQQLQLLQVLR